MVILRGTPCWGEIENRSAAVVCPEVSIALTVLVFALVPGIRVR